MSILERDCVLVSKDESGNTIIDMPVTRVNNVEGLGRNPGTAYSVGDVVMCSGSKQLQLICTTAGTTSTADLDISANSAGDTINDGTVTWVVAKRNYFDNSGTLPIANGGTGANNAKQARANLEVEPIGTIFAFAGNDIPSGYLPCNGSAISRTTYADLFAVIGTTYGAGDGSTTFNLPNLTDKFIQGSDTAGTVKSAGLPNITGSIAIPWSWQDWGTVLESPFGAFYNPTGHHGLLVHLSSIVSDERNDSVDGVYFDASKSNAIYGNSTTVQPSALTMRYIIKY